MLINADELIKAGEELGIDCQLLGDQDASDYIDFVIDKFKPRKTSGHLAIDSDSISVPLEKYEFSYSAFLEEEPAYVFFDQANHNRKKVVVIKQGRRLCTILENAYGMEYFVSNKSAGYLLAVNWYVIEGAGTARVWLKKLQ